MSIRMLLDHSPDFGMQQWVTADPEGVVIETRGNVHALMEANKRRKLESEGIPRGDQVWQQHVGRVPQYLWQQWCRENPELAQGTPDAQGWLLRKMQSREFREAVMTYEGKL